MWQQIQLAKTLERRDLHEVYLDLANTFCSVPHTTAGSIRVLVFQSTRIVKGLVYYNMVGDRHYNRLGNFTNSLAMMVIIIHSNSHLRLLADLCQVSAGSLLYTWLVCDSVVNPALPC